MKDDSFANRNIEHYNCTKKVFPLYFLSPFCQRRKHYPEIIPLLQKVYMKHFTKLLFLLAIVPVISAQDIPMQDVQSIEARRYNKLMNVQQYTLASAEDYDALYYRLNIVLRKDTTLLYGNLTMSLQSLVSSLKQIDLNFWNDGKVDTVVSNGQKLQFTHTNNILSVQLPSPLAKNQSSTIRIYYSSPFQNSAITKAQKLNRDLNKQITSISSQAEPYDARKWWPCKDDPRDKADSVDVIITTDSELFPASNGTMISDVDNGDGTHTLHWAERYPIVTYLVSVAAATFNHHVLSFTYDGKTMPVVNYYYSLDSTQARNQEKFMLDGLKIFSDRFITYPFIKEKYGMAEYVWGGAMEHQTLSSMGSYGEGIVVHELAHQWFGDKVTNAGFEHIWLNEGWATYCEALYSEAKNGLQGLKQTMQTKAYYGPGTVFVENPNSFGEIFNGNLSYAKAGWVLHMMRHAVGNSAFFRGVRNYLGDEALSTYRSVTTAEFKSYIETASGYDLTKFINNWIYGEYYPTYKYEWTSAPVGNQYKVEVSITQMYIPQRQIFDLPIDLTFRLGNRDTTFVVRDSTEIARFTFTLPFNPEAVLLDKDNWILKRVTTPIVNPTFDKGILLVNGVDWNVSAYTADIKSAFSDSIFTGNHPYEFWDLFPNPSVGYPKNITTITGSGDVLPNIMGKYCTVVWVANALNGDLTYWGNAPISEFIKAGGNVILLTRQGTDFIDTFLKDFLGVTWTANPFQTFTNYKAQFSPLVDMGFTGLQDRLAGFTTSLSRPENKILFTDASNPLNLIGAAVWGTPMLIDGKRSGNFIFLSTRPYRVEHSSMRINLDYLLDQMTCTTVGIDEPIQHPQSIQLEQNYPNPFSAGPSGNPSTTITFTIPESMMHGSEIFARLTVLDHLGREVTTLLNGHISSGKQQVQFNAEGLRSGVYYYRLTVGGAVLTKKMVLVR